ncbi:hypothetical protein QYF61_004196 [Mycteria americana]|uniref:Uncharacterized protein n=1 Tax=Mycteria americana TaxID=33587 RepID=A0AAN7S7D6_MYCAM|nr:hypothetical protein QYF61_004196 [Mycteria americana]
MGTGCGLESSGSTSGKTSSLGEPLATACETPFGNLSRLQQPHLLCAPLLTPSKNTSGFVRCHFSLPSGAGSSPVHRHEKGDKGSCQVPVPPDGRGPGSVGVFQGKHSARGPTAEAAGRLRTAPAQLLV